MSTPDTLAVEGTADAAGSDLPGFDVNAIIAKHAAALVIDKDVPPPTTETPAAPPAAQPAATVADTGVTAETPPAEKAPEPKAEDTLAAKRLAALARKEAELEAQKAALAAEKGDVSKQVEAAVEKARTELADAFLKNPLKFVRDAKVPVDRLDKVATLLLGAQLGDDADPQTKIALKQLELEMELEGIKQKQEKPEPKTEKEPPVEFQIRREMKDQEIANFTGEIPASEFPFLSAEAKEDRPGVYRALCSIYMPYLNTGEWPSVQTVARQLETQLRSEYERLDRVVKAQQTASSTQPPPSAAREAPKTLSDADLSRRPAKEPERVLTDAEYHQRAIEMAGRMGGLIRG